MIKFTTLICLMLCVIVGAVYANWVYARESIDDAKSAVTVGVTTSENSTSGTISTSGTPSFDIDQATESYTARLEWGSKNLTISFAAASAAPANVKDGVTLSVTFAVSTELDKAIDATNFEVTLNSANSWTQTVDLSEKIVVDSRFTLPTSNDYNTFKAAEKSIDITISMVENS